MRAPAGGHVCRLPFHPRAGSGACAPKYFRMMRTYTKLHGDELVATEKGIPGDTTRSASPRRKHLE